MPTPRGDPAKASTIGELNPAIVLLMHLSLSEGRRFFKLQSPCFDRKIVSIVTQEWTCYTLTSWIPDPNGIVPRARDKMTAIR